MHMCLRACDTADTYGRKKVFSYSTESCRGRNIIHSLVFHIVLGFLFQEEIQELRLKLDLIKFTFT